MTDLDPVIEFLRTVDAHQRLGNNRTNMGGIAGASDKARRTAVKSGWVIYRRVTQGGKGWTLTVAGEDHLKLCNRAAAKSVRLSE